MIALLRRWSERLARRKAVTILVLAMASASAAVVAADRLGDNDPLGESVPAPLRSVGFIPAGTTGESILEQALITDEWPDPAIGFLSESWIFDDAYLRGRVALVDIPPNRFLDKTNFRP